MPWGHRSIARAIFSYLRDLEKKENFRVDYTEVKMPFDMLNDIYTFAYRFIPVTNRLSTRIMNNRKMRQLFIETARNDLPGLQKQINWYKPDLVISTYFVHSQVLAKWKKEAGLSFKLWTVVADPWSVNLISMVEDADLTLVYDEVGEKAAVKTGIEPKKILKTGWWVRPEMYKTYDRQKMRQKLGFYDDRPVVFVGGGSLGTNSLTKLLPALMLVKGKVGLVFNTGTDKLVYNLVEQYVRLFKKIDKDGKIIIKNLGWIDNMGEVLAAVDMVFGKAGPNFLFDVVACRKPFVSITHIGGQEDGNIEIIKQKGLGWVKEKRNEAANFLLSYLKDPHKYEKKFVKTIEIEAKKNQQSMGILWQRIKTDLF